ncbi:MAG: nucleoside-diphosphate-sugar epimerase, partial [Cyclobacteriaceae bacterium]|nr:nucleoside-diphosphate-sugar epimerase [Cyclobacteriaceae bacterium]
MTEEYIQSQPLPQGKSYYILRPCMIHGPGNKGNLNLLYKLISNGIPYPLAAFENKRSFLSVENLCFVIRELLERDDIPSGIYNVSDDEVLSSNTLIKLIAKASD